ncbi:collagen-like protein, partial [Acidovorax cattleyae]|nr:collagen-like protein [Paracidovorax cattleyae]
MPKKRLGHHWAATTLCSVIALHAAGALAADVTVTPPAGGGFVVKGGNQERLRVQGTGEVYIPGLPSTGTSSNLTCYDAGTGQLTKCSPGIGGGATGATGPMGPTGATGPAGATGA